MYKKSIIKFIQKEFEEINVESYNRILRKEINAIPIEDLLSLIESVLEKDGPSITVTLDFIQVELMMKGYNLHVPFALRRILKALKYFKNSF